ncbi:MAG TPA: hypothetical protein VMV49_01670 [Candidatus Deferrimicrobium sp.]|nr:hypothetical protein [Candidatus Deferrimicrobium sp.]
MNGGFVDLVIEPPLWFIVSAIFAIITIYFINKYKKIGAEARPFILGLVLFIGSFTIARTIETIRRYYIGSYYDIIDSNFTLIGANLILRLCYYIIAWAGITIFYFVFEKHIMKKGMQKNTRYILTFCSAAEGFFSCLLYFTAAAAWVLYCVIILFFIVVFFPIIFFLYLVKMAISREQKIAWVIVSLGFLLALLGVMGDLPEASLIVTQYFGVPFLPPAFIHYGTPILQAVGATLLGIGFATIYKVV